MWIHKLLGLSRSRSTRRRQAAQNRRFVRPGLEGLEDRVTPTTTVQAPDVGTLVSDIAKFNSGSLSNDDLVIQLTGTSPYNLPSGQTISNAAHTLTIEGTSSSASVINAGPNDRAFDVQTGVNVTFEKLTIQGGDLVSTSSSGGGGIHDVGGDVTLSGVVVQNNKVTAGNDGNPAAQGGGIFVSHNGSLTIKANSSITNNSAIGTTPLGMKFGEASGGGIYLSSGSSLTVDHSSISGNLARGGSGQNASGGGVFAHDSTVNITDSKITGNIVQGGDGHLARDPGGDAVGGGLALKDDSSPNLTGNDISGNFAFGGTGGAGDNGGDASGGGLYLIRGESNVDLSNTSFSNNRAQGGNGGNATTTGINNGRGGDGDGAQGGGLWLSLRDGTRMATLSGVALTGNTAQGGSGGRGADATSNGGTGGHGGDADGADGGGAYFTGHGIINMINASVSGNTAQGGNGGGGGTGGTSTTGGNGGFGGAGDEGRGGGIYLSDDLTLNITNSAIVDNTAQGGNGGAGGTGGHGMVKGGDGGGGGDAETSNGSGRGGGIYYEGGTLNVLNTTIANNIAQGGNGGAGGGGGTGGTEGAGDQGLNGDGGFAAGGGVYDSFNGANGTFFNDTIAFNSAIAGSGGTVNTSQGFTSLGGGYFNANHDQNGNGPTVKNVLFQGNIAAQGPDFSGAIGQFGNVASESNNFFSSIEGTLFPNRTGAGTGTPNASDIVSTVNQLGPLTIDPATGLAYFPLLASSQAIDTGTNSTVPAIAAAQGVTPANATDEIGNPRVVNNVIDIGAIEFAAAATKVTVTSLTVPQSSSATPLNLNATVTADTVKEGFVTFTITDSSNTVIGKVSNVPVMNGSANTTSFTLPPNTPAGTYTITADYTDPGGRYQDSTGTGTLNVVATPAKTTVTPGNATVTQSSSPQTVGTAVLVTDEGLTVSEGTVKVTLMVGGVAMGSASAPVVAGVANITGLMVPAGLSASGSPYQLLEEYHDDSANPLFQDSKATGMLTVNAAASTSPTPVSVVGSVPVTTGNVPVTVTNTVTTTTNNSLPPSVALFFDIVAFILDQNGFSSISAMFNLPTTTTEAFAFVANQFNIAGGSLGSTVIPMAVQTGQNIVNSLQGR
jgi:hypothetical protein